MKQITLFGTVINKDNISTLIIYIILGFFSYLMILITLQYVPINFDTAFLSIKQEEIKKPIYQIAFFTHVYTSIFTLLLGFIQFSKYIRTKYPKLHKYAGRLYVILILFLAGPSGLIMGIYANGGIISQISFCILALFWMYFTYKAFYYAKKGEWTLHKNFMYRSYALTLSAISLRLFKYIIVNTIALPPIDTYHIVSWLGWIINLGIAEIIIKKET